jgi:uncharacterized SAM-binding protein YcdF (DUF218 family)
MSWWSRIAIVAFAVSLGCSGIAGAGALLVVPQERGTADVILVLGGDGPPRARAAAALFRAGLASRVVVSGDGDCGTIRDAMVARGIPSQAILLECGSRNTYENASLSAPVLARLSVRRALLVTSWFHLLRALACLERAAPSVHWMAVGAPPTPSGTLRPIGMLAYAGPILSEYAKLAWYTLHYGIDPEFAWRGIITASPEKGSGSGVQQTLQQHLQ